MNTLTNTHLNMKITYLTLKNSLTTEQLLTLHTIKQNMELNRITAFQVHRIEYDFDITKYDHIINDISEILTKSKLVEGIINLYLLKMIVYKIEYLISSITHLSELDGCELLNFLYDCMNDILFIFNTLAEITQ